jgi:hypothetical protein
MGAVSLGVTYGQRNLAETPLVQIQNLILEPNATNQVDGKTWLVRPGVRLHSSPANGRLRGVMQSTSGYPGKLFYVMGTEFFEEGSAGNFVDIGPVSGADTAIFAYHNNFILISANGVAHLYDGTTFAAVIMPDGEAIAWVCYLAGYFLLGVQSSQHIFFMPVGSTAPDALDFFSAETHSTNTVRAMVLNDQLAIFCEQNTEFWQPSGDPDLPFNRIPGQTYERGLASAQAIAQMDNTLIFVGNDLIVYRAENIPKRISDNTIEEQLRIANANLDTPVFQAWAYTADGHSYFVLTIDQQGTFLFDVSTGSWLLWRSAGRPSWLLTYGATLNASLTIGGNLQDQALYAVDPSIGTDLGGAIDCILTGGVPVLGPSQRLDSLTVMTNAGQGGTLANPVTIDLYISNDQGQTFSGPFTKTNGNPGDFAAVPAWRMMGQMKQPQCVLQFKYSVTQPLRISYARTNESFAP